MLFCKLMILIVIIKTDFGKFSDTASCIEERKCKSFEESWTIIPLNTIVNYIKFHYPSYLISSNHNN